MEGVTPRCPICNLGFINVGRLTAVQRFVGHIHQAHKIRCCECESYFASQTHQSFHMRYKHNSPCGHCNSFCSNKSSVTLGTSLSKNKKNKEAQTTRITRLEEEISQKTQEKIHQHMKLVDSLEAIVAILDQGY